MSVSTPSQSERRSETSLLAAFQFRPWTIPLVFAVSMLLAFGLVAPSLGFYMDDWHHLYFASQRGLAGLRELFLYDSRPFAYLFYWPAFNLLGYRPLAWQVVSLALRALAATIVWLAFRAIWPHSPRQTFWAALLFAIYPVFKEQQISIAYSLHWFGYSLYAASIWTMVLAVRNPKRRVLFTAISLAASFLHLFLLEYFVGVELIRPFILYLLLSRTPQAETRPRLSRWRQVFRTWLPYLLLLGAYVFYRLFLLPRPEPGYDRNRLTLLFDILKDPLPNLLKFLQNGLRDTLTILYTSWSSLLNPDMLAFTDPTRLKLLLLAAASALLLYFYLGRLRFAHLEGQPASQEWHRSAWWIGLALTLLGALPFWLTDQFITVDNPLWSNRYALAALPGAALVTVSLLESVFPSVRMRTVLFCLLVGLAIGWNLEVANGYRWSWKKQAPFYYQLAWRIPNLEPGTTFLSDGEIFPNMTEIETSFAISTLYPKTTDGIAQDYWFFSLSRRFSDRMGDLLAGMPLRYNHYYSVFNGQSQHSLVIFYEPEKNQCLWVLGPEDAENPGLPELTRAALPLSDLSRIQTVSDSGRPISEEIFGPPPTQTWCYFYENAALARQMEDWGSVVDWWQKAARAGLEPQSGVELLPFIEAFAHTGDWTTAGKLTFQADRKTRGLPHRLCSLWQAIETSTPPSEQRASMLARVRGEFSCAAASP